MPSTVLQPQKLTVSLTPLTPEKRAEALSNAASAKAAVIARHKQEWENHQRLIDEALAREDFNAAKLAKITAETIRIRQDGERKAWGIVDTDVRPQTEKIKILPLYPEVMDIEAHDTAKDSL